MFYRKYYLIYLVMIVGSYQPVYGGLNDYINHLGNYLGFIQKEDDANFDTDFNRRIPYEVSTADEKFISEAAKLTGLALSELDSCQQRVILKLKTDCHKLNDEQVAKLAVHLLNCQSYIEGRQTFACTEEMAIKDCTFKMDSDMWTIYHLMSNRARAVCYTIRQSQFRGLAENTVNRLMDAAQHQIQTLDKITINQENLQNIAHKTYDTLSIGHEILSLQQKDLQRAQFHGQLTIEENIARLVDEKRIIAETHNKLLVLTEDLQEKLEDSSSLLQIQKGESKLNHQELIKDLLAIHEQTQEIFKKIEEASQLLQLQSEEFKNQYEYTLKNLIEVNKTVHSLVSLVGGTKRALEDRLEWVSSALGGTDLAVARLYLIIWHIAFLLVGMIGSAFLDANTSSKIIVTLFPSLNLAGGLYDEHQYLNPAQLFASMASLIMLQMIINWIQNYRKSHSRPVLMLREKETSVGTAPSNKNNSNYKEYEYSNSEDRDISSSDTYVFKHKEYVEKNETSEFNEFGSPTPPLSRNGFYKARSRSRTPNVLSGKEACHATTRLGTPCKLNSLPGRDFCYRHQMGDSIAK